MFLDFFGNSDLLYKVVYLFAFSGVISFKICLYKWQKVQRANIHPSASIPAESDHSGKHPSIASIPAEFIP